MFLAFGPRRSMWHINRLELEVVLHSLQAFFHTVSGKAVRQFTDIVAFYVNRGGACSFSLSLSAEDVTRWCHCHGIAFSARHILGKLNLNIVSGQHFESSLQCSSHKME